MIQVNIIKFIKKKKKKEKSSTVKSSRYSIPNTVKTNRVNQGRRISTHSTSGTTSTANETKSKVEPKLPIPEAPPVTKADTPGFNSILCKVFDGRTSEIAAE